MPTGSNLDRLRVGIRTATEVLGQRERDRIDAVLDRDMAGGQRAMDPPYRSAQYCLANPIPCVVQVGLSAPAAAARRQDPS
jgi:hypothetical protein